MELTDTLEGIRRKRAMSQGEFADRLGVSRNTYSQTCSGHLPPRFEIIAGAVREFGDEEPSVVVGVLDYLRHTPRRTERS